jgi:hypothetical protein
MLQQSLQRVSLDVTEGTGWCSREALWHSLCDDLVVEEAHTTRFIDNMPYSDSVAQSVVVCTHVATAVAKELGSVVAGSEDRCSCIAV